MDFRLPELGEGVYEAELVAWLVKPGDVVKRGQNLMEVLTDKATMEVPAPFAGNIATLGAQPGDRVNVGAVVLTYQPAARSETVTEAEEGNGRRAPEKPLAPASAAGARFAESPSPAGPAVKAAPSVRYLARQLGVDLTRIHGTGPGGRVLLGDLSTFTQPAATTSKPSQQEPPPSYGTPGTRIKFQGIRRKIAEHLVLAKKTIPHYSYVDECDLTDLVRMRESLRDTFAKAGSRLTYLAFFVKAAVAALKEVPMVNSSLDEQASEIILHDRYHIGIAVAAPNGLIVPVIHDAEQKDLLQISRDIERLSAEARAGKIRLEDLRGGTFTVTSIGSIGGLISTPVINHPQVAILGVGKVVKRPIFDAAGNIRPADMIYLSLSFDHRVVDGAVGAAFGNALCRRLQNPATLLFPSEIR